MIKKLEIQRFLLQMFENILSPIGYINPGCSFLGLSEKFQFIFGQKILLCTYPLGEKIFHASYKASAAFVVHSGYCFIAVGISTFTACISSSPYGSIPKHKS
jgi:hypothetical protein